MDELDPADLRISDAERHRVAEVLRQAAGDGRIDLDELDERLEAAYAAKTYADLAPLVRDLPGQAGSVPVVKPAAQPVRRTARTPVGVEPSYGSSFAILGETKRAGVWDVGEHHQATAVMGSVVLDLRKARFPEDEVVVDATAVMGSVQVVVDAHVDVRVEGFGLMGSFAEGRSRVPAALDADSPVVRLRGLAFWGSVEVKRRKPPR